MKSLCLLVVLFSLLSASAEIRKSAQQEKAEARQAELRAKAISKPASPEIKERVISRPTAPVIESAPVPRVPVLRGQPKQGDTGRLQFKQAMISQITGPDSALVTYQWVGGERVYRQTVLLKGVSTDGYADDMQLPLPDLYTISGTYKYESVSGAGRTVLVMSPVSNNVDQATAVEK